MKQAIAALGMLALLAGCASSGTNQVQADLPVDKGTVKAGEGSSVTLKGGEMPLAGWGEVRVGEPLPQAVLSNTSLQPVNIAESTGKVRIISVVPSLDTPTCDAQTHELSEKNNGLDQSVELITVSMDLPFAQSRFAKEAKISNVTFLSDYKEREFGNNNGLVMARAVIVTDQDNIVRHLQVVPEVTALPDMQAAMDAARKLL
jgi:thiol peroxidase